MNLFGRDRQTEKGHGMYAVYDSAAASFGNPLVYPTPELAIRALKEACAGGDSRIAQNAGDYSMALLGRYVAATGELIPLNAPVTIITAREVMASLNPVVAAPAVKVAA